MYKRQLYEEGDLLSISEKIIALCQKRVVYRKDMKISWLAKFQMCIRDSFNMLHNGIVVETGNEVADSILGKAGGMDGTMWTINLIPVSYTHLVMLGTGW